MKTVKLDHSAYVLRVSLLQNETKFATCSDDKTIFIYRLENDGLEATLTCATGVNNIIQLKHGNLVRSDKGGKDIRGGFCRYSNWLMASWLVVQEMAKSKLGPSELQMYSGY